MRNQNKQSCAKTTKSKKQTKEDWKYVKITYLTKRKTIWNDDFRSKLTLNRPFSVDQEE